MERFNDAVGFDAHIESLLYGSTKGRNRFYVTAESTFQNDAGIVPYG